MQRYLAVRLSRRDVGVGNTTRFYNSKKWRENLFILKKYTYTIMKILNMKNNLHYVIQDKRLYNI